jgi:hypothetical protein
MEFLEYSSAEDPSKPPVLVGKNPLKMGGKKLAGAGLEPTTAREAIRLRCIDCVGGSLKEVRLCVSYDCANWPHRMGTNAFRVEGENEDV